MTRENDSIQSQSTPPSKRTNPSSASTASSSPIYEGRPESRKWGSSRISSATGETNYAVSPTGSGDIPTHCTSETLKRRMGVATLQAQQKSEPVLTGEGMGGMKQNGDPMHLSTVLVNPHRSRIRALDAMQTESNAKLARSSSQFITLAGYISDGESTLPDDLEMIKLQEAADQITFWRNKAIMAQAEAAGQRAKYQSLLGELNRVKCDLSMAELEVGLLRQRLLSAELELGHYNRQPLTPN